MKQRENNEIDLLLRGLARREGPSSAESEDSLSMHLDADELNSYVERTLPVGARARYTSHLADCSACRKMVYELTSASGVRVAEPAVSEEVSTGLRQKLRALFSPGLLRFALPAVAVLAFVAVGLVALRQQREPDLVALNQPQDSRNSSIERVEVDSTVRPGESPAPTEEKRSAETRATPGKGRETQAKPAEKNEPASVVTSTDSVTVTTTNRDASTAKSAGVVSSPSYAPEPPPPAPKSQTTTAEERSEVAARQKEEADKRDAPAREQEGTRAQTEDRQNQGVASAGRAAPAGQSAMRPRTGATYSSGAAAKTKDDDADTRTVSGRRFRRQGSVWIDTAYQPSTAITTVMRESEQFRALIADEPGIRAIAAQLSGEVVIVWKGKAYRIR